VVLVVAMYLTLMVERATLDCFLDCQKINSIGMLKQITSDRSTIINVTSPIGITPTYKWHCWKMKINNAKARVSVFLMCCKTFWATTQCSFPKLIFMNWKLWDIQARLGLVHTITCMRLSTTLLYGMSFMAITFLAIMRAILLLN